MDASIPSSSGDPSSSSPTEERESYVYVGLSVASKVVRERHPTLRVSLPSARPTLPEYLGKCTEVLGNDEIPFVAPRVPNQSETRRQILRDVANEFKETTTPTTHGSQGKRIVSQGLLQSVGPRPHRPPKTAEQRARFKENFSDILYPSHTEPGPHVHTIHPTLETDLPIVRCKLLLQAVDHEDKMPQLDIAETDALWDTGAQITFITDNLLTDEFRNFLKTADVNEPYRDTKTTRVQIQCYVEFTNTVIEIDTLASVVPLEQAPNGRSGIILGQRGLIDCVRYESVPRNVVIATENTTMSEEFWGKFELKCYASIFGDVHHY